MTILLLLGVVLATGSITFLFSDRIKARHRMFSTFSAAVVAALIFVHLLPDIYSSSISAKWMGLALLIGLILQLILEKITHGIEHGHEHSHAKSHKSILIGVMMGLGVHAFIEGMPISIDDVHQTTTANSHAHDSHEHHEHEGHEHVDYSEGKGGISNKFISAILMHKVPVTLMLSLFLLSIGVKPLSYFGFLTIFALMTPLGMISGEYLMKIPSINSYKFYLLAISTGMLLHIITSILFEHGHSRKETNIHIMLILSGVIIGVLLF